MVLITCLKSILRVLLLVMAGRNVYNGPASTQIIIFWTKYYTINVHTNITFKCTLILKNTKQHLNILEANQKQVAIDRESILGIKEHHWMSFLFLKLCD